MQACFLDCAAMHRHRLLAIVPIAAGLALVVAPDAALAHGLVGREDLPIPKWLFGWAAAAVLVASFVALAVLWPEPRLEQPSERRVAAVPRFLDPLAGALGVAIFALTLYAGFAGDQTTTNNLAPTFIFVLFWVGLALVRLLEARLGPQHGKADEGRDEHDGRRPAEQPLRDRQVLAADEAVGERGLRRREQDPTRDHEEREQTAPVHAGSLGSGAWQTAPPVRHHAPRDRPPGSRGRSRRRARPPC